MEGDELNSESNARPKICQRGRCYQGTAPTSHLMGWEIGIRSGRADPHNRFREEEKPTDRVFKLSTNGQVAIKEEQAEGG